MGFKMKGSAFKLGTVQGTSSYRSALQQSCPAPRYDKDGNITNLKKGVDPSALEMKAAFKQYDREELEG